MHPILQIRLRQLSFMLEEIGVIRALLLLPFLGLFFFNLLYSITTSNQTIAILVLICLIAPTIHLYRPDKAFLKQLFPQSIRIYLLEYSIIQLPFLIALLFSPTPLAAIIPPLSIPLIKVVEWLPKRNKQHHLSFDFYPPQAFEWKAHLRQYWQIQLGLYLIALIASQFDFAIPVLIAIITLTFSDIFRHKESKEMLETFAPGTNPSRFLIKKTYFILGIYSLHLLPLLALFLLFHAEYWFVWVYVWLASLCILGFGLCFKYATWQANQPLPSPQLPIGLLFLCFLIPFLLPVPLIVLSLFIGKAKRNLTSILKGY